MKVIRKKPGCEPEIVEVENTLEALQREVEGYIEAVTLPYGAAIICNEEGRLHGLPECPMETEYPWIDADSDGFCNQGVKKKGEEHNNND